MARGTNGSRVERKGGSARGKLELESLGWTIPGSTFLAAGADAERQTVVVRSVGSGRIQFEAKASKRGAEFRAANSP